MNNEDLGQLRWQQYKRSFLKSNHCTAQKFHDAYVSFMEGNPDITTYRQFARQYQITIHHDPNIPPDMQVVLSVNIAAIKVMSQTYEESILAIKDILRQNPRRHAGGRSGG